MEPSERLHPKRAAAHARSITPVFPLLLLEAMRDIDRPTEVLEDEDLTVSMPRRFGLSMVVDTQIRRFREEVRRGRPQSPSEVADLIRLVIRRPDAGEIFGETGRRVARHAWEKRSRAIRGAIRILPGPLSGIAARRAARRLFRKLAGNGRIRLGKRPPSLEITGSLSASADPEGTACTFYAGAFGELLQQYTGRTYRVLHPRCEARGDDGCEWTVLVSG